MPTRSAIKYFGGKGDMLTPLLALFPPVSEYDQFLDAYGGSGIVLLNKPRCQVEVYNDLDHNVYTLFKVLISPAMFGEFQRRCELALYDEMTSTEYRTLLRRTDLADIERAFYFWYVNRTRRGGNRNAGFSVNYPIRRNMSKSVSDFLSSIEGLDSLHARLSNVIVRNADALSLIPQFDRPRSLIYCDPPYHQETRTTERYPVDADSDHHQALIAALNAVSKAYVVVSGYDHPLYDDLRGFTKHHFQVNTVSGQNQAKQKTETVWCNFTPAQLTLETSGASSKLL